MILKFSLEIKDRQHIEMPCDIKILTAQNQNGVLVIWGIGTITHPTIMQEILIYGTGILTVQMGHLVWHVFSR